MDVQDIFVGQIESVSDDLEVRGYVHVEKDRQNLELVNSQSLKSFLLNANITEILEFANNL